MTINVDPGLVALDRFVSSVYWADDDVTLEDALIEAIDDWIASASAEHNNSEPFGFDGDAVGLGGALTDLIGAVECLAAEARRGLTVATGIAEALADWRAD